MERIFDIAVVGGGPSGLAAAIKAKEQKPGADIALIEKMKEPAKKLSASGNGKGNLSNKACDEFALAMEFFAEIGVAVRADDQGRIYPYSEEAKTVSRTLINRALRLGVEMLPDTKVEDVEAAKQDGGFRILVCRENKKEIIRARRVLIATGGKSYAAYGSTGDGQVMARKLGHTVAPLVPALTAIETAENLRDLKGIRAKAELSLFEEGRRIFKEAGELQFREDSVSGICAMNMSSKLPIADKAKEVSPLKNCKITVNFVPDFEAASLIAFLKHKASLPGATAEDMVSTLVKRPIGRAVLARAGIDKDQAAADMSMDKIIDMANGLRMFELSPTGRKGWKEAQVTGGGVSLSEIDLETMESKLIRGLYFAGEVTDYDGPCGGYNLNNAWVTGIKAGRAMAESL